MHLRVGVLLAVSICTIEYQYTIHKHSHSIAIINIMEPAMCFKRV